MKATRIQQESEYIITYVYITLGAYTHIGDSNDLTEHFTSLDPHNPEIGEPCVLRKCQSTDFESKYWCYVRQGSIASLQNCG